MITDVGFGITGDEQLKSQSNYTDVYYYIMQYRSTKAAAIIPEWLGKSLGGGGLSSNFRYLGSTHEKEMDPMRSKVF